MHDPIANLSIVMPGLVPGMVMIVLSKRPSQANDLA
jgi:hypothetical protein